MEKFQDLIVWQKSMQLVKCVYDLTSKIPVHGNFAIIDQMRRAAISIPSNIAEGHERNSTKEYLRFLSIAAGSKSELHSQVEICKMLSLVSDDDDQLYDSVINLLVEVGKMLNTIIKKLS
ncbi:MAG TPA: four helix bundle protein [Candidatus Coproplasma excrementipullorum]|nr:four helix bundle protein [Candidatus Coproplasma excrementipullorum]